jgi:hypothetical protein
MQKQPGAARVFPLETRFQNMAKRPGGLSRDRAISRAEAAVTRMQSGFKAWFALRLREIGEIVSTAEYDDAAWAPEALRLAGQIHETAGTLGLQTTAAAAEVLCEIFSAIEARQSRADMHLRGRVEELIVACEAAWPSRRAGKAVAVAAAAEV